MCVEKKSDAKCRCRSGTSRVSVGPRDPEENVLEQPQDAGAHLRAMRREPDDARRERGARRRASGSRDARTRTRSGAPVAGRGPEAVGHAKRHARAGPQGAAVLSSGFPLASCLKTLARENKGRRSPRAVDAYQPKGCPIDSSTRERVAHRPPAAARRRAAPRRLQTPLKHK